MMWLSVPTATWEARAPTITASVGEDVRIEYSRGYVSPGNLFSLKRYDEVPRGTVTEHRNLLSIPAVALSEGGLYRTDRPRIYTRLIVRGGCSVLVIAFLN